MEGSVEECPKRDLRVALWARERTYGVPSQLLRPIVGRTSSPAEKSIFLTLQLVISLIIIRAPTPGRRILWPKPARPLSSPDRLEDYVLEVFRQVRNLP